jgi:hypothetical protein
LERAEAENPANVRSSPFEAAALKSRLWRPGRTLRVAFLDGDPKVQAAVTKYAKVWSEHANIELAFGAAPAEIRISFEQPGSWSALGTDALVKEYYAPTEPTMNYGWLTPKSSDKEISRVVLHEFGHALGLIHEHQNPAGDIQWNRDAVIEELSGPPNNWDLETIQFNVFDRYATNQTQFTEFDPKSIMLYAFPAHWTRDGMTFPNNSVLSKMDKAFIRSCYPR